jgi:hypothetical protein
MLSMRHFLSILLASFLAASAANAQIGGNTSYAALNLVSSARIASLGGNLIAVKDGDMTLGMYNPALLNKEMDQGAALSYVNYMGDINFGFAGYTKHIDSIATFSATLHYLNYGRFEERSETGEKLGEFSAGDYALTIGAGRQIDSLFSVGANFKMIYSSYYSYNAFALALDMGATFHKASRGFTASFLIKNFGLELDPLYTGSKQKLPFEAQIALSKKLKHAPFRFSLAYENLQQWDISYIDPTLKPTIDPTTGEEIPVEAPGFFNKLGRHMVIGTELVAKNFSIGFGYNFRRRQELKVTDKAGISGFSFGLGMNIKKIRFSYGLASYNRAGISNHITVAININEWMRP